MNKNLELYRDELENAGYQFFILDTKGKGSVYGDVDFVAYYVGTLTIIIR